MCQVMKLPPELEERMLTLLHERILPVAQKSLRLWRKGDHTAGFIMLKRCTAPCKRARMHPQHTSNLVWRCCMPKLCAMKARADMLCSSRARARGCGTWRR